VDARYHDLASEHDPLALSLKLVSLGRAVLITTERAWNTGQTRSEQPDVAVEPKLSLRVITGLLSEGS
jgi:hypothetical protein